MIINQCYKKGLTFSLDNRIGSVLSLTVLLNVAILWLERFGVRKPCMLFKQRWPIYKYEH